MSSSNVESRRATAPLSGNFVPRTSIRVRNVLMNLVLPLIRSPKGLLGTILVTILFIAAIFGPVLAPHDAFQQELPLTLAAPSPDHPFGNDEFGRDILSRLIIGARLSIGVGVIPPILGALIGVPLGLLAGYRNNLLSLVITRIADIILAFPGILVAITLAAILGPGLITVGLGITIFLIPGYIRIVFGEVLSLREREFILAARCIGASDRRILLRHILPNVTAPIIVQLTLNMAVAVLAAASLSYLGLGAQPPAPEWGAMISSGQQYLRTAPHVVTFPGLAILLLVLGFSLVGDTLRDSFDPVLRRAG